MLFGFESMVLGKKIESMCKPYFKEIFIFIPLIVLNLIELFWSQILLDVYHSFENLKKRTPKYRNKKRLSVRIAFFVYIL